jgi:hypothetical protein
LKIEFFNVYVNCLPYHCLSYENANFCALPQINELEFLKSSLEILIFSMHEYQAELILKKKKRDLFSQNEQ